MPALDDLLSQHGIGSQDIGRRGALDQLLATPRAEKPTTVVGNALAPITRLPGIYAETAEKNFEDMSGAWKDFWKAETWAGRAWDALRTVGGAASYTMSAPEAAIRSFAGEPVESVTGIKGLGKKIGEWGSFATQLAVDPIAAAGKAAGAVRGSRAGKAIERTISPTTLTPESRATELMIRPSSGDLARSSAQAAASLEQFRGVVAGLDRDTRLDFMLEMGGETPTKPLPVGLQPVAKELRQQLDERTGKLQSIGLLPNAIQDYWPRLWKDPKKAQTVQQALQQAQASGLSKNPVRGSRAAAGLKQRTLATMRDGLNAGLEPITDNPLDIALIRMRGMDKWYYGSKLAAEMKAQPYVRHFASPDQAPTGWRRLDDSMFTTRLPPMEGGAIQEAKRAIGASALTRDEQGQVGARLYGTPEMGGWFAPEPAARVFNNYTSRGWAHENGVYDAIRHGGNMLNMLQLGLSAFHYGMVSIDTTVSTLSRMPSLLRRGEFAEAAKILPGAVPLAGPVYMGARAARRGADVGAAYLNPAGATPELQRTANLLAKGGGRKEMDVFYEAAPSGSFLKAIKGGYLWDSIKQTIESAPPGTAAGKAVVAGARLAGRALQTVSAPLMEMYVPAVKRGVFRDLSSDWLAAHPTATEVELRDGMAKIWDSIDNRLGQLVYDNLFWQKTQKDLAFLLARAVGWNLGTVRELGGGAADAIRSVGRTLRGTPEADITLRTQYAATLPVVAALQGALLTYLYTGRGPQQLLDYFYPPTGRISPQGAPERVSMPTYVKDIVSYNMNAGQTIMNKLHPLFELAGEYYRNRDYYGAIIRDPERGDPAVQSAQWLLRASEPFGIRGMERQTKEGADIFPIVMSEFGFIPAPVSVTDPHRAEMFQKRDTMRARRALRRELAH